MDSGATRSKVAVGGDSERDRVTRIDTVVIGAGQAGLSASYHLTQRGREHVVLERGDVGETWRSQRWDNFVLNTPNLSLIHISEPTRPY